MQIAGPAEAGAGRRGVRATVPVAAAEMAQRDEAPRRRPSKRFTEWRGGGTVAGDAHARAVTAECARCRLPLVSWIVVAVAVIVVQALEV
jgi:hypothetical protein